VTRREWIPLIVVVLLLVLYLVWTWIDRNPEGRFEGVLAALV
jgi:hypothetical protein